MKFIAHILVVILYSSTLFGQTGNSQIKTLNQIDSLEIDIIKVGDNFKTDYFLVFNSDSILLHSLEQSFSTTELAADIIYVDSCQQLDHAGHNVIFLYHIYNTTDSLGGHNKTKYIVNIDTKKVMFKGKYYYNSSLSSEEPYTYKVSPDENGNLIIEYDYPWWSTRADLREGLYFIENGEYVFKNPLYKYSRKTFVNDEDNKVEVVRYSSCEIGSGYYVVHNNDSLLFLTNGCMEQDRIEYDESARIEYRQLNDSGKNELILEWDYSGLNDYHSDIKEIIVVNLDSMEIMFRKETQAHGQHVYGEKLGDHYGFKYEMIFMETGEIIIQKPTNIPDENIEERYVIQGNQYVQQ